MEKRHIAQIYKKEDKQYLKNYRPVSRLPICEKIMKELTFDNIIEFFIENKLIATNQSGFKPGDPYISQLLSITNHLMKGMR